MPADVGGVSSGVDFEGASLGGLDFAVFMQGNRSTLWPIAVMTMSASIFLVSFSSYFGANLPALVVAGGAALQFDTVDLAAFDDNLLSGPSSYRS